MLEVTGSIPVSPTIYKTMNILFILLLSIIPLWSATITIPNGAHAKWISQHLANNNIIDSPTRYYLYLRFKKLDQALHSGTFDIQKNASFYDITQVLTGKAQQTVPVTIPEGFTITEIAATLETHKVITNAADFLNYVQSYASKENSLFSFLPKKNLEGFLFPDTYKFAKYSSNKQVLHTFLKRFQDVLIKEYNQTKNPPLSFYATLKLAAIIEKEAGTQKEMPIISGVFHNRLKKKMYLASCPTVGYAMGEPRKKSLTYRDLDYKSPYNTYRNKGLTPTPIAAPGKAAFKAALNPNRTPYLYFVSKNDGSGTHVFSKTLKQHLAHQKRILATTKK
jgi:UPF0755 protein